MPRSIHSNRPACSPMCKLPQLFKGYRTSAINTYFLSTQKKNELGYLIQSTLCVWLCIHNSSARCFFLSTSIEKSCSRGITWQLKIARSLLKLRKLLLFLCRLNRFLLLHSFNFSLSVSDWASTVIHYVLELWLGRAKRKGLKFFSWLISFDFFGSTV